MKSRRVVLTIAGSDNSAGAGAQADLKTITAHGCYGLTAITCVVAEVPGKVSAIQPVKPEIVAEQVALSFEAFPVAAVKTGMLYSTAIIEAVASILKKKIGRRALVIDPVMVASSGDPLLKKSAIAAYEELLFPLATLITPNLDELRILSGQPCRNLAEMKTAGTVLIQKYGCAVLLKGGHLKGRNAVDILATKNRFEEFSAPFLRKIDTHGTGCTFSAAIAANLAKGLPLAGAVAKAKRYLTSAIKDHLHWKRTVALNHFGL